MTSVGRFALIAARLGQRTGDRRRDAGPAALAIEVGLSSEKDRTSRVGPNQPSGARPFARYVAELSSHVVMRTGRKIHERTIARRQGLYGLLQWDRLHAR